MRTDNILIPHHIFKFRAWDDHNKKWLLGYEYQNLGGFDMFGECVLMGEWGDVACSFIFEKDGKKQSDLKLMQFTGITDINKKLIYEGDIVNDDELGKGVVVFNDGCFYVKFNNDIQFLSSKRFEVIGNIFDNPNLVNK